MNILIVGAGAVGTVYGRHLQLGGANVCFYVREKYVSGCRNGFTFYSLNRRPENRYQALEMKGFDVISQFHEVSARKWDFVLLAVSSTALRGPWLNELIQSIGNAILVTLQPGFDDREYILERFAANRLIEGTIPIVSYFAPLPGEQVPAPGIAYWLPPGSAGFFSGPTTETNTFVKLLKQGRFPAKVTTDARQEILIPSIVLTYLIAALESAHWKFKNLDKSAELKLACDGMIEGIRILSIHRNAKTPLHFISLILKPFLFRGILLLSRWIVPFDFETYLKVHFTKVQDQMHQSLEDIIKLAHLHSVSAPITAQLQKRIMTH